MKISKSFPFVVGAVLLMPIFVFAQGVIENPLAGGNVTSVTDLLINITRWLLGLVGVLALLGLVLGGIRMILAFGKEDQVKNAKQIIMWSIAGLAVVLLSYAIISIVTSLLGA